MYTEFPNYQVRIEFSEGTGKTKKKKYVCFPSCKQPESVITQKKAIHFESPAIFDSGGGYRVRTSDLWIMIPSLYRLS